MQPGAVIILRIEGRVPYPENGGAEGRHGRWKAPPSAEAESGEGKRTKEQRPGGGNGALQWKEEDTVSVRRRM